MAQPTARLSSALLVADVNDFLNPSETCVLPMGGGAQAEPAGSVLTPIIARASTSNPIPNATSKPTKATITLSDCLTCSGCVTTAETVLLSSVSIAQLRREQLSDDSAEARRQRFTVAGLSQQAVASIATRLSLPLHTTARKLAHFLRSALHFDAVVDMSLAREMSLTECAAEFIRRYRAGVPVTVCSACPGWLAYAEKTLDADTLAAVSAVRSPQAVLATLAQKLRDNERTLWLATVMPCHDKKIEAARPEYVRKDGSREVDCVVTAGELLDLVDELGYDLRKGGEDDLLGDFSVRKGEFGTAGGSGSGGYAEHVMRVAAKELLDVAAGAIVFEKASRSGDMRSAVVESKDGSKRLRFALAYGFRSLQSILRKMKKGECPYDYIELMACPGGCNNGGGQLPLVLPDEVRTDDARGVKAANASLLKSVEETYFSAPRLTSEESEKRVGEVYEHVVQGEIGGEAAVKILHTTIVSRKTTVITPNSLAW